MLGSLLDLILPPVCSLCDGGIIEGAVCVPCGVKLSEQEITSPACAVCGIPFLYSPSTGHTCGECLTQAKPFVKAQSPFIYEGGVADAIHRFKYGGKDILGKPLGRLLAAKITLVEKIDLIIPVPLHKNRLRERGFNQALLLAREISKAFKAKVDYMNLKRVRETAQQINLKHEERKKNVAGAFELKDAPAVKGKTALLVDDVYTTGATLIECSKVLKKAGATVYAATLARAIKT